jgi:hypothetical protein
VAARGVVEAVNVLADGQNRRRPALQVVCVVHLSLEGGEEALGDGVDAPMFRQAAFEVSVVDAMKGRFCRILKASRAM